MYAPTPGALPVGTSAETTLMLTVTDNAGLSASNNSVKIRITSVNNAPQILNVPPLDEQPVLIPPAAPLFPFAGLGLSNDDTNPVLFTIAMDNAAKGSLSNLGGFAQSSPGVYQMTGAVGAILGALTNLSYTLNASYLFPSDDPGGTTFALAARDYALLTATKSLYIQVQEEPRNHLVVRTQNDGLPGSFTYALAQAGNNDVITFALPAYPAVIRLPGSAPSTLTRSLTLKGPGANLLTLSGDHTGDGVPDRQLFRVRSRVTIEGLTLAHGTAAFGGAVLVESNGFLTLRRCAVVDSSATEYGGAIDVDGGQLTLDGCFIARNRLAHDSGMSGGGVSVYSDKAIRIVNTTFDGNVQANDSGDGGGALVVQNRTPSTPLNVDVIHATFAANTDASARASAALGVDFGTRLRLLNSIFGDASGRNLDVAGTGEILSLGGNLCDDSTQTTFHPAGLLNQASDLTLTNPLLAPLNLGGDPTPFYGLLPGSPAIDSGLAATIAVDQRGVLRTGTADRGAIEHAALGRLVINEIFFDDAGVNYLELFVRRDSTPLDLAPFSLYVDGVKVHDFADSRIVGTNSLFPAADVPADTWIQPGFGLVLAFTNMPFMLTSSNNPTPVVRPSVTNAALDLKARGLISIGQDGSPESVARQAYLGVYLSPVSGTNLLNTAGNSLTLAPQYRGYALVPNSFVLPGPFGGVDAGLDPAANPASPGADASGTPFGQDNAEPLAVADYFTVTEDDDSVLGVLANDYDGDGTDRLVIVDVSTLSDAGAGDAAMTTSRLGAAVSIWPAAAPLRGAQVHYDPRQAPLLQELPVGVEIIDEFHYEVIDIGSAPVAEYEADSTNTRVTSVNHRLNTGDEVVFSGVSHASYNQTFTVEVVDEDTFTIPEPYPGPVAVPGSWETVAPRSPSARSEAVVSVRVIGVNDPPVAGLDRITNVTERSVVRLMTRPELAGSALTFPGDPAPAPDMLTQDVLSNDTDIDTDDTWETLRVAGVLGGVNPIAAYSGTPGAAPVTVQAPAHGLSSGDEILVANYGGHPSYNGTHAVTVLDDDSFTLPRFFVDDHPDRGVWVVLNEATRYAALTDVEAEVTLVLRADPREDHILYDASASSFLQGLAEGELYTNRLYYAVADRNGGIGIGTLDVVVVGVNNTPVARPDPSSLGQLDPLVGGSNTLADVLAGGLDLMYVLPPTSGGAGRTDLHALDESGTLPGTLVLQDFFTTDEDTPLDLAVADLLANDTDVDRIDVLDVVAADAASRLGAAVTLAGGTVTYDPSAAGSLQALVRGEMVVDSFAVVVSDAMTGGTVTSLVAVLVTGLNDTPVANPAFFTTHEDEIFTLDPLFNDTDADIDGQEPDNRLALVPAVNVPNPGLAQVDMDSANATHDATVSGLLNGLAAGQSFTNEFEYTVTDNSFLFAVDDEYYVPAGTQGRVLNVLANDRDYTDADGVLTIIAAGPALHQGLVDISPDGTHLVYSAPDGWVGDDHFRYTIRNDKGDVDSGRVTVRSVVPALNGVLHAANDAFSVAAGETVVLDVLANDGVLPQAGAGLTITALVASSIPGQPVLTNNTFLFEATHGLAPLTFTYEVSAGGTARATAEATVNILERRGTLRVQDDTFSVLPGSFGNELDVLANDGLVTESKAPLRIQQILDPAAFGTLTIHADGTRLVYSPQAGFIGIEPVRYLATDQIGGTGTGQVSIVVGPLDAVSDFYTIAATTNPAAVALPVLANDRMLPNPQGMLTLLSVDPDLPVAIGTLQVGGGGTQLLFTPSNSVGQQDFNYVVQDAGTPARTATGRVTIATVAGGTYANPDRYVVRSGGTGYVLPVLTNDIGYPNVNRTYSILSIGTGPDAPDRGGTVTISGNRLLYSPAAGFAGEESFTYLMSDSVSTDVARVTVSVRRGDLFANDDAYAVFYELEPGTNVARRFTLPVLLNDRIHPPLDQVMEITSLGVGPDAPDQGGVVEISPDRQSLLYRPVAVPALGYVEQFTYEISDGGDRRAAGVVRVQVENRASNLVAATQNDTYSVARNSVGNVLPVLANDYILPGTAAGWSLTGVSAPVFGGTATLSGGAVVYRPAVDFTGTDEFTYSVNDGLGGTGFATVQVRVGSLPTLPSLFTVLSDAVEEELDVLANDVLEAALAGEYTLHSVFGATAGGTLALSGANTVLYTPDSAHPGPHPYTESFFYRVDDDSAHTVTGQVRVIVHAAGSDRSTAAVVLQVEGRNDAPVLENLPPNPAITDKETAQPFLGVTLADADEQGLQPVDVRVRLDDAAKGILDNLGDFVDVGGGEYALTNVPAGAATLHIRDLDFVPTENRIPVGMTEPAQFTISVTDHQSPPVLDTNTVITVTAVNDAPLIAGTEAGQEFYYKLPLWPFRTVTITELDDLAQQPVAVTVEILEPRHGELMNLGSFIAGSNGLYAAAGLTAAEATAQLRAMTFTVGANPLPVEGSQVTPFRITVSDGIAPAAEDLNTSVIARQAFEAALRPALAAQQGSFGLAVDAIADYAVVGAPQSSVGGADSGAAFLYQRVPGSTNTWVEWRALLPATVAAGHEFGRAVALTEDALAIGAIRDDAGGVDAGAVYVFERNRGGVDNWDEAIRIVPTNLAAGAQFGLSVALAGDWLAVGAPGADLSGTGVNAGAVLLFGRHQGGPDAWGEILRWAPADAGSSNALFGWSVALAGDRLVVGAPQYNTAGGAEVREGAVFYLHRDEGGPDQWGPVQTLTAAETNLSREFGWDVALEGTLLAVGAPGMAAGAVANAGRVFIHEILDGTPAFALLRDLDRRNDTERRFGHSVSIQGSQVFIGAPENAGLQNLGAAYLFERGGEESTAWTLIEKLVRPAGSPAGFYGSSVRYRQGTAIVGAPWDHAAGTNAGHAFLYRFRHDVPQAGAVPALVLAPASTNLPETAATGLTVALAANVAWTAVSNVPWIVVTGGSSGSGDGVITYRVAANAGTLARTGGIVVAGGGISRTARVVQAGAPVILDLAPVSTNVPAEALVGRQFAVAANVDWTAVADHPWIGITGGTAGSGNGTVTYDVAENTGAARSGTITVSAGGVLQTFTVGQAAASGVLVIDPASRDHGAGAVGGQAIAVTAAVAWTAQTAQAWITITGGDSDSGDGTVTYAVDANAGAARSGAIAISGGGLLRTFTVNQAAFFPSLEVAPASRDHSAAAASGQTFAVTANVAWTAITSQAWISLTGGTTGAGNGTVTYGVAANTGLARSGSITLSDGVLTQMFTVNQAAGFTSLTIDPASRSHAAAAAGGQTIEVTANVAWTAAANEAWISITGGSPGSGNGAVTYSIGLNAGAARSGTITIAGGGVSRIFTVGQAEAPPALVLAPASTNVPSTASTGRQFAVAANVSWTVVTNPPWLTVTDGETGSGNGAITFSLEANVAAASRTGGLVVAGGGITVTGVVVQAPAPVALQPALVHVPAAASAGHAVAVTAGGNWTVVTNGNWITVTAGNSGSGDGTLIFSALANPGPAARTGTVTVTVAGAAGSPATLTIVQSAPPPALSVATPIRSVGSGAGSTTFAVANTGGGTMFYTASESETWLGIAGGGSGANAGTITVSFLANPGYLARTGTVTVSAPGAANAPRQLRVVQAGLLPPYIPADAYEPDSTIAAAKSILNGQIQRRSIHWPGDVDWVSFRVGRHGASRVQIETSGPAGDTEIWVTRGSTGALMGYSDDISAANRFSRVELAALAEGTYFIKIQEKGNDGVLAAYSLRVQWIQRYAPDAYEPDNSRLAARVIRNGQTQNRTIHQAGNRDWAKFTIGARGARNLLVETRGPSGDTELFIYDSHGRRLFYDDDSGPNRFSRIRRTTIPAGTYYVRVQEKGNDGTISAYTLHTRWTPQ
jgi:VCBS repeat-containing protein